MQRMLLADALNAETPARERAQVARAWKDLEEQKRILKMKPAPKAVDPNVYKEKERQRRHRMIDCEPFELPPSKGTE